MNCGVSLHGKLRGWRGKHVKNMSTWFMDALTTFCNHSLYTPLEGSMLYCLYFKLNYNIQGVKAYASLCDGSYDFPVCIG